MKNFWKNHPKLRRTLPHVALFLLGVSLTIFLVLLGIGVIAGRWLYINGFFPSLARENLWAFLEVIRKGAAYFRAVRLSLAAGACALLSLTFYLTHILEPEWSEFEWKLEVPAEVLRPEPLFSEPTGKLGIEGLDVFTYIPASPNAESIYDESVSVYRGGKFAGEIGLAVSQRGLWCDQSDKVWGLEAWVFDPTALQTVTAVYMTPYTLATDRYREKAAARGSIVNQPHLPVVLETKTLRVTFRLSGQPTYMEVSGAPAESVFASFALKVTVEEISSAVSVSDEDLPVWLKPRADKEETPVASSGEKEMPEWMQILQNMIINIGETKQISLTAEQGTSDLLILDEESQIMGHLVVIFAEEMVGGERHLVGIEVFVKDNAKPDASPPAIVIPSEFAASDEWLRTQLGHRGELLEKPHEVGRLETARMIATVVLLSEDVVYAAGTDGLPERAAFESVTLKVTVSEKETV